MTDSGPAFIHSRDNPLLKDLRRLAQDSTAYRKQGRVWLEGDHLCRAAMARGIKPELAVFAESFWPSVGPEWARHGGKDVVVADALFDSLSALESPARMGLASSACSSSDSTSSRTTCEPWPARPSTVSCVRPAATHWERSSPGR